MLRTEDFKIQRTEDLQTKAARVENENNLRSTDEVLSYSIEATDTNIGHIEDFIVDEETWIDTSNWLPASKKVIISPEWVERVDWAHGTAFVNVTSEKIKESPEYDPNITLDRDYETALYNFYGLPYYW